MKTVIVYLLGIPCILAGSRFAGLDKALVRESAQPQLTVLNDLVGGVSVDQFFAADFELPEFVEPATKITPADEQLVAIVVPKRSANVEASAKGTLRTILVGANDVVEAGQRLALLDTREIESDIRKQQQQTRLFESRVREARGEHVKIAAKLQKRAPLVVKRVVAAEEYHDLQVELQVAAERIEQFEAEVATSQEEEKKLQGMLADYVVTAPFSGRVKRVVQHAGQFLEQGDVVVELESKTKQVRALVPTSLSQKVPGLNFHIEDADGGRIQMTIAEINETGAASGYQDVLFELENADKFISNQSVAVVASPSYSPATIEQEFSTSLAAH